MPELTLHCGDVLAELHKMKEETVHCSVSSPPYWGLRDYGIPKTMWEEATFIPVAGLPAITIPAMECVLGLEADPWAFVGHMVLVYREVRRVLKKSGTAWVNLGDTYATGGGSVGNCPGGGARGDQWAGRGANRLATNGRGEAQYKGSTKKSAATIEGYKGARPPSGKHAYCADVPVGPMTQPNRMPIAGLKPKDLCGIPWMVAKALQADGWWLRSDIIWYKPNPMPESAKDRPCKAHEYIFLLSKSRRYYYDHKAIEEETTGNAHARGNGVNPKAMKTPEGWDTSKGDGAHGTINKYRGNGVGFGHGTDKDARKRDRVKTPGANSRMNVDRDAQHATRSAKRPRQNDSFSAAVNEIVDTRNKRTVWQVPTFAFKGAHFATYPPNLIRPAIRAGSKPGQLVLDPFMGSGTTGLVSLEEGRSAVGIDLSEKNIEMARHRCEPSALERMRLTALAQEKEQEPLPLFSITTTHEITKPVPNP